MKECLIEGTKETRQILRNLSNDIIEDFNWEDTKQFLRVLLGFVISVLLLSGPVIITAANVEDLNDFIGVIIFVASFAVTVIFIIWYVAVCRSCGVIKAAVQEEAETIEPEDS